LKKKEEVEEEKRRRAGREGGEEEGKRSPVQTREQEKEDKQFIPPLCQPWLWQSAPLSSFGSSPHHPCPSSLSLLLPRNRTEMERVVLKTVSQHRSPAATTYCLPG